MVKVITYQPDKFNDLIERIWILENKGETAEIIAPPDQYVNLVFPLDGASINQDRLNIEKAYIEGITLHSTKTNYQDNSMFLGIRFFPSGVGCFVNTPGTAYFNKKVFLSEFIKELPVLNINELKNGKLRSLESFFTECFDEEKYKRTNILRKFYRYFRWEHQLATIEEFCNEFGTNYTTLNRSFTKNIGISAKRFERLIKFRKALCELTSTNESFTNIGLDAGYFDQSHFIREFKLFMNYSPKVYNKLIRKADKEAKIINYNFELY